MNIHIETVNEREAALALAPYLERCAAASEADWRDDDLPDSVARRFLERRFDDERCVLVVARPDAEAGGSDPLGVCLTGPFEDPLTAEAVPFVVVLHVAPSVRHQGLARALTREARKQLAARGERTLAARASHNDDAFISMGERWGFVRAWELMIRGD